MAPHTAQHYPDQCSRYLELSQANHAESSVWKKLNWHEIENSDPMGIVSIECSKAFNCRHQSLSVALKMKLIPINTILYRRRNFPGSAILQLIPTAMCARSKARKIGFSPQARETSWSCRRWPRWRTGSRWGWGTAWCHWSASSETRSLEPEIKAKFSRRTFFVRYISLHLNSTAPTFWTNQDDRSALNNDFWCWEIV